MLGGAGGGRAWARGEVQAVKSSENQYRKTRKRLLTFTQLHSTTQVLRPEDGNGAGKGGDGSGGGGASSRRRKEGRTASKSMIEVAVGDEAVGAGAEDDGSR